MTALELLAPARNAEIGIAAIDCGADAVYIAGPGFGARQAAGNSVEDVRRLCEYAHRYGARVYATLNTIIFEEELEEARRLAEALKGAGADALIVQDLALLDIEGIPLHASTQCAVRTPEKAAFYEGLGFSRIILEREMSLEQIRAVRCAVDCELEFFVHGALCVCYSGQCYMSQHVAGRSANRGECVQACRSRYDLVDSSGKALVKDKALLSLKDYRLLEHLGELAEAGICSFKIEGRLKNISYVRNVTREYSLALDALIAANPEKYCRASFGRVLKGFAPNSRKTFNRGYTSLFIDGRRGKWSSMDAPKGMGEHIGSVESVREGRNSLEICIRPSSRDLQLRSGDGFSVITRDGVTGFRGDLCKGLTISCKKAEVIAPGMQVYRNLDTAFEAAMETNPCVRLIPARAEVKAEGLKLFVTAVSQDGRTAKAEAEGSEAARDGSRMAEMIRSQLSKSAGIFSFSVSDIQSAGTLPLLPASHLNALRRDLASKLESQPCHSRPIAEGRADPNSKPVLECSYKDNIANSASATLLRDRYGITNIKPAFELLSRGKGKTPPLQEKSSSLQEDSRRGRGQDHTDSVELMRTKYCIKYELGLCPKHQGAKPTGPLFLENNGRRFPLLFDCHSCEMAVMKP